LVIVPVKHYALEETLAEVVPAAGDAEFLLLTQNWRGTAEIDPILPRTCYVYGDAKAGGAFSAGTLVAALKAVDIGPPEGEPSTLAAKVAAPFRAAGIPTRLHSDMLHYLWVQYAVTGGPWAALVQAGSFDALFSDRSAASAALTAARECLEVVGQRGVDLVGYPETKPFLGNSALRRQIFGWIMRWVLRHDEFVKRCSSHALGDPVEVATFYDDLIATGHDHGVAMPVMESYAKGIRRLKRWIQPPMGVRSSLAKDVVLTDDTAAVRFRR
jgi:ketopantoate reductase